MSHAAYEHGAEECERSEAWQQQRLDGELAAPDAEALSRHLAACPSCAAEAEQFQSLRQTLRSGNLTHPVIPSGSELARRVLAEDRGLRRARWSWPALVLAPGAGLAAVMLSVALRPPTPEAAPVPAATAPAAALPVLFVSDDEDSGRQVVLAPPRGG